MVRSLTAVYKAAIGAHVRKISSAYERSGNFFPRASDILIVLKIYKPIRQFQKLSSILCAINNFFGSFYKNIQLAGIGLSFDNNISSQ